MMALDEFYQKVSFLTHGDERNNSPNYAFCKSFIENYKNKKEFNRRYAVKKQIIIIFVTKITTEHNCEMTLIELTISRMLHGLLEILLQSHEIEIPNSVMEYTTKIMKLFNEYNTLLLSREPRTAISDLFAKYSFYGNGSLRETSNRLIKFAHLANSIYFIYHKTIVHKVASIEFAIANEFDLFARNELTARIAAHATRGEPLDPAVNGEGSV
jgi:hypothetical protein